MGCASSSPGAVDGEDTAAAGRPPSKQATKRAQDSRPLSEPPLSEPLPEAASTPASARSAGEANAPDPDTDFFDPVMQTFRQVTQRVTFDPVPVMHTFRQMTNRVTTAINEELHAFNDVLTSGVKLGPTTLEGSIDAEDFEEYRRWLLAQPDPASREINVDTYAEWREDPSSVARRTAILRRRDSPGLTSPSSMDTRSMSSSTLGIGESEFSS